ncbi:MAG: ATP-binding protein [Pseudonocardiaceae bacterium]
MKANGSPVLALATVSNTLSGKRELDTQFIAIYVRTCVTERGAPTDHVAEIVSDWVRAWQSLCGGDNNSPPPIRQLPPDVTSFTGRATSLAQLDHLLDSSGMEPGAAVVISAIAGMAGVGKTALAVHWAMSVQHRFPDGQLYIDLRGYDFRAPMTPADALHNFLYALGVPEASMPSTLDARSALYRSLLADRRMLVVLDNARDAEQVRPLIPASRYCFTVVTSRDMLAGLIAGDGAQPVRLDLLDRGEAIDLLSRLVGHARVAAEPHVAELLIRACGYLPLGLRVAAQRVVQRHDARLADLVAELATEAARLDVLEVGNDPRTAVRVVFSWSYRCLPPQAALTFRMLGRYPGIDIGLDAAAALTGLPAAHVRAALETLVAAHLVESRVHLRYHVHDLLRVYGAELAARFETAAECHEALVRVVHYYLRSTQAAARVIDPQRRPAVDAPAPPDTLVIETDSYETAVRWLELERPNIAALTQLADDDRLREPCWALADSLLVFLDLRKSWEGWAETSEAALTAARRSGNHRAEVWFLNQLGHVYSSQRRNDDAMEHFHAALEVNELIGDHYAETTALTGLAIVFRATGRLTEAIAHGRQALSVARDSGHRLEEARARNILGTVYREIGRYEEALAHLTEAVALRRELRYRPGVADSLTSIAVTLLALGRCGEAAEHAEHAYRLWTQLDHREGQARSLIALASALHQLGRSAEALDHCRLALELAQSIGHHYTMGKALSTLSDIHRHQGAFQHAADRAAEAVELCCATGHLLGQARARVSSGLALAAFGRPDEARAQLNAALVIFVDVGNPEAERVRALLAANLC